MNNKQYWHNNITKLPNPLLLFRSELTCKPSNVSRKYNNSIQYEYFPNLWWNIALDKFGQRNS